MSKLDQIVKATSVQLEETLKLFITDASEAAKAAAEIMQIAEPLVESLMSRALTGDAIAAQSLGLVRDAIASRAGRVLSRLANEARRTAVETVMAVIRGALAALGALAV